MAEKKNNKEIPFEEALEKLEDIVDNMEDGELSLDDMIKNFEEGNKLAKYCNSKLKSFEKKIEILTEDNAEGGEWDEFDPESGKRLAEPTLKDDPQEPEEDTLF